MYDFCLIIPCYNEAPRVTASAETLVAFFSNPFWHGKRVALVFVNDGSTDETAACLAALSSTHQMIMIRTVSYETNKGKGGAIIRGAQEVEAHVYGFIDTDLAFPLETFQKMYLRLAYADLVVGKRTILLEPTPSARIRWSISHLLQWLTATWLHLPIRDTQCGIKIFSKRIVTDIFPKIQNHQFAFDPELIARVTQAGMAIETTPVAFQYHNGSSVRLRDGMRYVRNILQLRKTLR